MSVSEAEAISDVAAALADVSGSIESLGNGAAATPLGAIEALGIVHQKGFDAVAHQLGNVADALMAVALAIKERS